MSNRVSNKIKSHIYKINNYTHVQIKKKGQNLPLNQNEPYKVKKVQINAIRVPNNVKQIEQSPNSLQQQRQPFNYQQMGIQNQNSNQRQSQIQCSNFNKNQIKVQVEQQNPEQFLLENQAKTLKQDYQQEENKEIQFNMLKLKKEYEELQYKKEQMLDDRDMEAFQILLKQIEDEKIYQLQKLKSEVNRAKSEKSNLQKEQEKLKIKIKENYYDFKIQQIQQENLTYSTVKNQIKSFEETEKDDYQKQFTKNLQEYKQRQQKREEEINELKRNCWKLEKQMAKNDQQNQNNTQQNFDENNNSISNNSNITANFHVQKPSQAYIGTLQNFSSNNTISSLTNAINHNQKNEYKKPNSLKNTTNQQTNLNYNDHSFQIEKNQSQCNYTFNKISSTATNQNLNDNNFQNSQNLRKNSLELQSNKDLTKENKINTCGILNQLQMEGSNYSNKFEKISFDTNNINNNLNNNKGGDTSYQNLEKLNQQIKLQTNTQQQLNTNQFLFEEKNSPKNIFGYQIDRNNKESNQNIDKDFKKNYDNNQSQKKIVHASSGVINQHLSSQKKKGFRDIINPYNHQQNEDYSFPFFSENNSEENNKNSINNFNNTISSQKQILQKMSSLTPQESQLQNNDKKSQNQDFQTKNQAKIGEKIYTQKNDYKYKSSDCEHTDSNIKQKLVTIDEKQHQQQQQLENQFLKNSKYNVNQNK
ncbi:hypothetical protein PPERSA_07433 [Pseudocohnilembus persalinus]|uniref:Uncharacterized protein n=1 Tax=Pseudocohnilembus persalinus TaxID=266149 RepID=A0A0V0QAD8_PSEPJ|nr:hypothetical protein PPERSA_07433 [Pseudocohnilembus persalinus]|eukprot:KRW99190.1 hypothetical protein PPERSA_07433 [Pseudocohnilembus persalinus]